MKKILIILLAIISSCVSQKEIMDSYIGTHKSQVLAGFGPCQGTQPDGSGGEILIYSQVKYFPPPPGVYGPGQNIQYLKYFYLNSSGYVYYCRTDRRTVAPGQMEIFIR